MIVEAEKFESQVKKLQGLCDEHNLVYKFQKDKYPITLTIKTTGGFDGQMSMLENAENDGYRSPDARLIFVYEDGELDYHFSETFTISDTLLGKLKIIFRKMHFFWLQYFFRDIIERSALSAQNMPTIEDDEDSGGDIADETFDDLDDDMEPLESFEDEEGGTDDYKYDEPED